MRKFMNKIIITMIAIIVVLAAVFTAVGIINSNKQEIATKEETELNVAEEEIFDECTEEYETMQSESINTNAQEEKTSPNCSLLVKTYFKKCEHTTNVYLNLPEHLVNLTKEEIQEKYSGYTIQSFSSDEIVLYREKEGECGEHYLVKDNEGVVTIYKILEDETLREEEYTDIYTEYLPEADKTNLKEGIKVNGKQNLNELIENFE